ncbi:MAG: hypothetical protein AB7O44_32340 [Hyphomicrobiaceae bacterium]
MIAALIITVCAYGSATDCDTFPTGVTMPLVACRGIQGQIAALEWLRAHPFFEFHELRGWACETGEPV